TSMDMLALSVEAVTMKVKAADLKNVRVVQGDALDTRLEKESLEAIILFGVIPAPMLPMEKLLTEMHRILKPGGDDVRLAPKLGPPVDHPIRVVCIFQQKERRHQLQKLLNQTCTNPFFLGLAFSCW
ncbi:MAG TPA: methyltransferase domain-containing protein, partial [Anaerolineales bacterium]|nr:methyltransferase domain-containing protein [Anaerolineales bacterium]